MEVDDFVMFLRTFIFDRLSGVSTRDFMDKYKEEMSNLTISESEAMAFHDFVIEHYPELIEEAFRNNDTKVMSVIKLMGDSWMMRADMHRKMCIKTANCKTAYMISKSIFSNN